MLIVIERGRGKPEDVISDAGLETVRAELLARHPEARIEVRAGNRDSDWVRVSDPARPEWNYLYADNAEIHTRLFRRIKEIVEDARPGPEPGKLRTDRQHKELIGALAYDIVTFGPGMVERDQVIAYYSRLGNEVRFLSRRPIPVDPAEWPALIDEVLASLEGVDVD